jgi:hypothetical protein
MTSVLAPAHGLPGGVAAPPSLESCVAAETLPSSGRPLSQHLEGLRSVSQAPTETSEIGALIQESLKPLTEMARQGVRLELSLPPSPVRVRAGWLAAYEVLRILARRVLENVYDGGVLSVDARLLGDRIIVEMAHSGGTLTTASPDTYPSPAEDPRFRRVKALLLGIGSTFILERQLSGGLSVWVALDVVQE